MSTMLDYNLVGLVKELQKEFRIQDWDIEIRIVNSNQLLNQGLKASVQGLCTADRNHGDVLIELNKDHQDNQIAVGSEFIGQGWFYALIHEMIHIIIDPLAENVEELLKNINEEQNENLSKTFEIKQERLTNHFMKILVPMIDVDWLLNKHKKEAINESKETK